MRLFFGKETSGNVCSQIRCFRTRVPRVIGGSVQSRRCNSYIVWKRSSGNCPCSTPVPPLLLEVLLKLKLIPRQATIFWPFRPKQELAPEIEASIRYLIPFSMTIGWLKRILKPKKECGSSSMRTERNFPDTESRLTPSSFFMCIVTEYSLFSLPHNVIPSNEMFLSTEK